MEGPIEARPAGHQMKVQQDWIQGKAHGFEGGNGLNRDNGKGLCQPPKKEDLADKARSEGGPRGRWSKDGQQTASYQLIVEDAVAAHAGAEAHLGTAATARGGLLDVVGRGGAAQRGRKARASCNQGSGNDVYKRTKKYTTVKH